MIIVDDQEGGYDDDAETAPTDVLSCADVNCRAPAADKCEDEFCAAHCREYCDDRCKEES